MSFARELLAAIAADDAVETERLLDAEATKADPKPETWWFLSSHEYPEDGCTGGGPTREEAIARGRIDYPGEDFYLFACRLEQPGELMPTADRVLEMAADRATDAIGREDYADEVSDEGRAELRQLLSTWAEKHLGRRYYIAADEKPERIENGDDPPQRWSDTEPAPPPAPALMADAVRPDRGAV